MICLAILNQGKLQPFSLRSFWSTHGEKKCLFYFENKHLAKTFYLNHLKNIRQSLNGESLIYLQESDDVVKAWASDTSYDVILRYYEDGRIQVSNPNDSENSGSLSLNINQEFMVLMKQEPLELAYCLCLPEPCTYLIEPDYLEWIVTRCQSIKDYMIKRVSLKDILENFNEYNRLFLFCFKDRKIALRHRYVQQWLNR